MPRGYPVARSVKRELFDRVCGGVAVTRASVGVGRVAQHGVGVGGVKLAGWSYSRNW